ncbi:uncharacterized protein KZ484_010936 [Pholidichthys leucotaenia]
MEPRREDVQQQNGFKQEEVLDERQLLNQERNFVVVQMGTDCSQIKEEQEDVFINQEGEQFGLKQEAQTFDEDAPHLHDCKGEEVLTVQQLCNQERNSSLDQEEQDAAQVKEEEEEPCSSQEEEDFGLKQETDTFMVTPTDNVNSKTEPNSERLLSLNSPDSESQDQGAGKNVNPGSSKDEEPKPKKRLHRNRSDRNNVDNSSMPENQCDTDTGEKSVKCSDNDKDCKNKSQKKHHTVKSHVCNTCGKRFRYKCYLSRHERIHTGEKPFSCEACGQNFIQRVHLKTHMRIHTGEKPFSCETCGQRFNRLDRLKTHMRIHTGEKPFSCETCGQSFIQRISLKTHMRIHTAHVHLKLYGYLEKLQERVLYIDTDSLIYVVKNGEMPLELGNYLGDLTDELDGDTIQEIVSTGPKSYVYQMGNKKKAVMKVKG